MYESVIDKSASNQREESGADGGSPAADISEAERPQAHPTEKAVGAAALDWHPRPPKIPPESLPGFEGVGPAPIDEANGEDHIIRSTS